MNQRARLIERNSYPSDSLSNNTSAEKIEQSVKKLRNWIENNNYEGYEPFDGLLSYLRPLTFGNCFAERVLEQSVLRCPFNIRPLLGIRPRKPAQGMGYLAHGYLRMWVLTKEVEYKELEMPHDIL